MSNNAKLPQALDPSIMANIMEGASHVTQSRARSNQARVKQEQAARIEQPAAANDIKPPLANPQKPVPRKFPPPPPAKVNTGPQKGWRSARPRKPRTHLLGAKGGLGVKKKVEHPGDPAPVGVKQVSHEGASRNKIVQDAKKLYAQGLKNFNSFKLYKAPKLPNTKMNIMAFREGSAVDIAKLNNPTMELQHDDEADLEEVRATEGAGTEYMGAKEKARANRYKRKKPKTIVPRYFLKDATGVHLQGDMKQKTGYLKYFVLENRKTKAGQDVYQIYAVDDWYEFQKYRAQREGETDENALETHLKKQSAAIRRFFREERDPTAKDVGKKLAEKLDRQDDDDDVEGVDENANSKKGKHKKKATKKKTMRRGVHAAADDEQEDVDNVDEEFFAPDSDEELGGVSGRAGVFKGDGTVDNEAESSESDEEFEKNEGVARGEYQNEQKELFGEDENKSDEENENEEEGDPDGDVEDKAKPAASKRAREEPTKDVASVQKAKRAKTAAAGRSTGLSSERQKALRNDVIKYLKRKPMTFIELVQKLKKHVSTDEDFEATRPFLESLLKEVASTSLLNDNSGKRVPHLKLNPEYHN
eukprot:m.96205 g.96205  ORF g.96205 m.96205 type:complete len:588 (+) comp13535_c2_seq1:301-2064(+)